MIKVRKVSLLRYVQTVNGWTRRKIPNIAHSRGWEHRLDSSLSLWGTDVTALGEYQVRWYEPKNGESIPRYESAGSGYEKAHQIADARSKRINLECVAEDSGIKLPSLSTSQERLQDRLEKFLIDREAKDIISGDGTKTHYRSALADFFAITEVSAIDQITAERLATYRTEYKSRGLAEITQYNRYGLVVAFLAAEKPELRPLLKQYAPRKPLRKTPVCYTEEDLAALLTFLRSKPRQAQTALAAETYCKTGIRKKELAYLTWEMVDLKGGFISIKNNQRFRVRDRTNQQAEVTFLTKTRRDRALRLPLDNSLLGTLRDWRLRHPNSRFVFATRQGNPDRGVLGRIKRAVNAANLNCGVCEACLRPCGRCAHCRCWKCRNCTARFTSSGKKLSRLSTNRRVCSNPHRDAEPCAHIWCHKWNLHKFRHTFATTHIRKGTDLHMVKDMLGHTALSTTEIYTSTATEIEAKERANKVFA